MLLSDLIKALKEELKHGAGDRELRPDVSVAAILSPTPLLATSTSKGNWDSQSEPVERSRRRTGQAPTAGSAPSTSEKA